MSSDLRVDYPGIKECNCCTALERKDLSLRTRLEHWLFDENNLFKRFSDQKAKIVLTSLGSGKCGQECRIVQLLKDSGWKNIDLHLVDICEKAPTIKDVHRFAELCDINYGGKTQVAFYNHVDLYLDKVARDPKAQNLFLALDTEETEFLHMRMWDNHRLTNSLFCIIERMDKEMNLRAIDYPADGNPDLLIDERMPFISNPLFDPCSL